MAQDFKVKIVSPSAKIAEDQAVRLVLPGSEGYMTLLPDHAQMVAELGIGEVQMTTVSQQKQRFFLAGGFVEVEGDEIRVLADVVEEAEEIDVDRAKASHDRAVDRLDEQHEETDVERANKALKRAKIRMMVAETLAAVTK